MNKTPRRLTPWLVGLITVATAAATFAATPSTLYVYDNAGNIVSVTDTGVDPKNCSGAGIVCSTNNMTGVACTAGTCTGTCTAGFADCINGRQVDGCETPITTTANCGGCGIACSTNNMAGVACTNGTCTGTCAAGFADCVNGKQVDGCETPIFTSISNCGSCGTVCSTNNMTGVACMNGACIGSCVAGFADCVNGKQVDGCETPITTTSNCGGCGVACSTNHVNPVCSGGSCSAGVCAGGYADCNGNKQADGCETPIFTSTSNCGSCGTVCSTNNVTGVACMNGTCTGTCTGGFADCVNGKQVDGCETPITTTANCGSCGTVCSTNNMTGVACTSGTCTGTCAAGFADCVNGKQVDGCETPIATTSNCGSCGTVCSTNHMTGVACTSGTCTGTCSAGFADCVNGKQVDGCETSITTPSNCGSCGRACTTYTNFSPTCASGTCGGACTAGWGDCNANLPLDGCETPLNTDSNCGACGRRCLVSHGTATCSAGSCVLTGCSAGYHTCNGTTCITNAQLCN